MFKKENIKEKYQKGIILEDNRIKVRNGKSVEYDIIVSKNIFSIQNPVIKNTCRDNKVIVYISPHVYNIYGENITKYFEAHFANDLYHIEIVQTTELNKNWENVLRICDIAKEQRLDRKGIMIAIGGGILNDLVGFAAAIYRRGMPYIRICTTLLSQIDVAVGIKVGANFKEAKNFIGAFYPPMAAINDQTLLNTLPQREIRCGMAEIIKMAIVCDRELFDLVESNWQKLLKKEFEDAGVNAIMAKAKLRMLEELYDNLYETNLERLVDFGHSFSSRIESSSNYSIQHGEAVAMDMALSSKISQILGMISREDYYRIVKLILNIGLELLDEKYCKPDELWQALYEIYLHRGKKINLVVPTQIGKGRFIKDMKEMEIGFIRDAMDGLIKDNQALRA